MQIIKSILSNVLETMASIVVLAAIITPIVWFLWNLVAKETGFTQLNLWQVFLINITWNTFSFFKVRKEDMEIVEVTEIENE